LAVTRPPGSHFSRPERLGPWDYWMIAAVSITATRFHAECISIVSRVDPAAPAHPAEQQAETEDLCDAEPIILQMDCRPQARGEEDRTGDTEP